MRFEGCDFEDDVSRNGASREVEIGCGRGFSASLGRLLSVLSVVVVITRGSSSRCRFLALGGGDGGVGDVRRAVMGSFVARGLRFLGGEKAFEFEFEEDALDVRER